MNQSAADLQREAESARAGLSDTLDELRNSLTTAAITNGAMTIAKEGSSTLARVALERARANPLAALLIGAGVMMLLGYGKKDGGEQLVRHATKTITGAAKSAASAAEGAAGEATDAARRMSRDVVEQARGAATNAAGRMEETAAFVADRAREALGNGMDKARTFAADAQGRASQFVDENRHYLTPGGLVRLANEQPVVVAALGVAVGAALGAALPLGKSEGRDLASVACEPAANGARREGSA